MLHGGSRFWSRPLSTSDGRWGTAVELPLKSPFRVHQRNTRLNIFQTDGLRQKKQPSQSVIKSWQESNHNEIASRQVSAKIATAVQFIEWMKQIGSK